MKRKIVRIDAAKCNGCGLCVNACHEGALRLVDGKAVLVSEAHCDGLGACLPECPMDAIRIETREAAAFDEAAVKASRHPSPATLDPSPATSRRPTMSTCACPGSQAMDFRQERPAAADETGSLQSQLRQWPIQLHLINPAAPYYQGADVLLTADCVAYALGGYHGRYLKGKALAIACPKLDEGQDEYAAKIKAWIDEARINTLTVMIMQVPCCRGLLALARQAAAQAQRKVPVKCVVVSLQGEILEESWA
jgi:NAD-dependent dihydropyrimidine dehydrogenase PreA subunit